MSDLKTFNVRGMGIEELAEAIPPAYTKWIGQQVLQSLRVEVEA